MPLWAHLKTTHLQKCRWVVRFSWVQIHAVIVCPIIAVGIVFRFIFRDAVRTGGQVCGIIPCRFRCRESSERNPVARESVRTALHSGPAIHRILPHPAQRRLPRNGRPALPRPLAAAPHRRAAFRAPQRILRHQTFRPRARPPARHDVRHPCTSVSLPDHIRRGGGKFFTMRSSPDYLFRPLHSGSCAPICASI